MYLVRPGARPLLGVSRITTDGRKVIFSDYSCCAGVELFATRVGLTNQVSLVEDTLPTAVTALLLFIRRHPGIFHLDGLVELLLTLN